MLSAHPNSSGFASCLKQLAFFITLDSSAGYILYFFLPAAKAAYDFYNDNSSIHKRRITRGLVSRVQPALGGIFFFSNGPE